MPLYPDTKKRIRPLPLREAENLARRSLPEETAEQNRNIAGADTAALMETENAYAAGLRQNDAATERLGLSRSGYADYLRGVAYAERERARERARTLAAKETGEKTGTAERSGTLTLAERRTVLSALHNAGLTEKDDAYRYCVALGLSQEDAALLSSAAEDAGRHDNAAVAKTVDLCIRNTYFATTSYSYALGIGLSEEQAQEVSRRVQQYWDTRRNN